MRFAYQMTFCRQESLVLGRQGREQLPAGKQLIGPTVPLMSNHFSHFTLTCMELILLVELRPEGDDCWFRCTEAHDDPDGHALQRAQRFGEGGRIVGLAVSGNHDYHLHKVKKGVSRGHTVEWLRSRYEPIEELSKDDNVVMCTVETHCARARSRKLQASRGGPKPDNRLNVSRGKQAVRCTEARKDQTRISTLPMRHATASATHISTVAYGVLLWPMEQPNIVCWACLPAVRLLVASRPPARSSR
eukprot:5602469-Pleurochrysis_carterae.AAC.4